MPESSSSRGLCPDWVFSNNSNAHACKDRGWFSEYTPFQSVAGSIHSNGTVLVAGVGTVILPVKKKPNRTGRGAHGKIHLYDVLHIPDLPCNILGSTTSFVSQYPIADLGRSKNSMGSIIDVRGQKVAYFAPNKPFFQVKLSGPPVGPAVGTSCFDKTLTYILNVSWSADEMDRWEEYKQARGIATDGPSDQEHSSAFSMVTQ